LGEIALSGGAYRERSISSFLGRGTRRLQLHSRIKYVVSLGVHEGKAKREVCSLQFLKARTTKEGGDSSRAISLSGYVENLNSRLTKPTL
jgi:hypothetical protein